MGISLSPGPVPIPLYAQKVLEPIRPVQGIPGMVVSRVADVDPELQSLMSLVLQIVDGRAFRR